VIGVVLLFLIHMVYRAEKNISYVVQKKFYTEIKIVSYCKDFEFNFLKTTCTYIPFDIFPTRCNITQFIYFWKTALHVSGGTSTHHQEHTTVFTVSGTC